MWDLQWGGKLKFLNDIAKGAVTEDEIPYALRNRPSLNQFQRCYYDMFMDLSGSRQFTASGVAEIPYHFKIMWLDENDILDPNERKDHLSMVAMLDGAYLKHFYKDK